MASYCSCGSLIVNNCCTNKNCNYKVSAKSKEKKSSEKGSKRSKSRRASKCIVYNLYDQQKPDTSNINTNNNNI